MKPLLEPGTRRLIETAVSAHLGRTWQISSSTDLADRSSHPAMVLHGNGFAVFAKLADRSEGAAQIDAELAGLRLIGERSGVAVPVPIGGRLDVPDGSAVVIFEALDERIDRTAEDWRAIGRTLAQVHEVTAETFGATEDGYFGPLRQDNRPVESNHWADFYAVRRILPWLRTAYDAGSVDSTTVQRAETLVERLPGLVGPEPTPTLLHGDAQHHNFVSTPEGAVVIDPSPYFGHPELDLALLDYFEPVPADVWEGYREVRAIDPGFGERRELWRVFAYLAVLTVDGHGPSTSSGIEFGVPSSGIEFGVPSSGIEFGALFRARLTSALDRYL